VCPNGFEPGELTLNAPGGQVTMYVCLQSNSMTESQYQTMLMKKIRALIPGSMVLKMIPDTFKVFLIF
jgi:hypothetical protein